jgi:hypothetical protein
MERITAMAKNNVVIGRIVHYVGLEGGDRPAIITHVWSEQTVNLNIFPDASYDSGQGINYTRTSITYSKDLAEKGHWHWPHDCEKKDEADLVPTSQ